jgi:hypothetical protein
MESTELARLRQVAGKQTTRLTHYGRKTGKPNEVTIWFVLDGDRLYTGAANVNRQWVQNVQKTPQDPPAWGRNVLRVRGALPRLFPSLSLLLTVAGCCAYRACEPRG